MTALPKTTKSRLLRIPQAPGVVWEGDRRPLGSMASHLDLGLDTDGECIIWVDGLEGAVRAMDVVSRDMGIEAVVRTFLRAVESPHHPGLPHRPQKIVVGDREIQFFLRGVLQDLEIDIEYSPQLPLIDRLFESFGEVEDDLAALPEIYQNAIEGSAEKIWQIAPWESLADSDILRVELKNCLVDEVYVCVMGMMSAEYGVLLYRSLDSLKQFRAAALGKNQSSAALEKAFLAQDCWFLNYEITESESKWIEAEEVKPFFGSLHPFEGMRPFLDEEEAKIIFVVLESLHRFCDRHRAALSKESIGELAQSYRITRNQTDGKKQVISTKVSSLPELAEELLNLGMTEGLDILDRELEIPMREDFVPDGSLVTLDTISAATIELLKKQKKTYYQPLAGIPARSELPTVFIQTTRPKAKHLIERLQEDGGLKSVCFNPGENQFTGESFNLGMLQTEDEELHIFAEYSQDDPEHIEMLEDWHQSCKESQGYCILIVAMGATGSNRGDPQLKDMLGLFEVKSVNGEDLGMGVLELIPNLEF